MRRDGCVLALCPVSCLNSPIEGVDHDHRVFPSRSEMVFSHRTKCFPCWAARSVPARRTTQHPVSKLLLEARIEPFHQFMPTLYNKKRKERNNTNRGRWVDVLSTARSEAPGCSNSYNTLFKHQETHQHFYQISSEACLRQTAVGGVTVESQEKLCL